MIYDMARTFGIPPWEIEETPDILVDKWLLVHVTKKRLLMEDIAAVPNDAGLGQIVALLMAAVRNGLGI